MNFDLLKLNEYKREWQKNPSGFMTEMLGMRLAPHQKKMLETIWFNSKTSIKSANGCGKSHLLAAIALAFFFCFYEDDVKNTIVVFTAPNFPQVRENIYNPIRHFIDVMDDKLKEEYDKLPDKIKQEYFPNGAPKSFPKLSDDRKLADIHVGRKSYILGVSTDGENSNVGKHGTYVLCIFDEAQGVTDKKMTDFRGITSSGKIIRQVMIGNTTIPNGLSGPFYKSFDDKSQWKKISISCFDTPNFVLPNIKLEDFLVDEKNKNFWRNKLDRYCNTDYYKYKKEDKLTQWEEKVKAKLEPWSDWMINPIAAYDIFLEGGCSVDDYEFRTRCLAEFPPDTDGALIPQEWIDLAFNNYYNEEFWKQGSIIMGVDIAQGTGGDKSAISIRNGNKIVFTEIFNLELVQLVDKIEELYIQFNVECINIETDGVGRDKAILLEERGLNVNFIQVGAGAGEQNSKFIEDKEKQEQLKKDFVGKRDEVWWNFRNLINPNRKYLEEYKDEFSVLLPPKEMLRQELSAITFKRNDKSKIKIASKDEIKTKISRSPDMCDSIIMAFANSDDFYLGGNLTMISITPSIQRPRF